MKTTRILLLTPLLFLFLIAGMTRLMAGTFENLTYSINASDQVTITDCVTTATGELTIPATIEDKPVEFIGYQAFLDCASITSIKIPETVKNIAGLAFYNCSGLTSVVLPSSLSDYLGTQSFKNCTALKRAVFKGNAPSTVDSDVFQNTAFGFKIYHRDDASGFSNPWNGYATESYDSRFSFEIIAGSPETIKITDYPLALESTEIDVPSTIVGLSVSHIGAGAFSGQMLAARISLPNSITRIENDAFYECAGLTTFTIPANVTYIGAYAFGDAFHLDSLFFKGNAPSRGANIFDGRTPKIYYLPGNEQGFEDDDYPWANIEKYTGLYDFVVYKETITITSYPDTETGEITIPETIVGKPVKRIGELAFYGCDELTRISLPESLVYIYREAFERCSGLTTLTIPANVLSIGDRAYSECSLDSVFFEGNAPSMGSSSLGATTGKTVYYRDGKTGFSNPWHSYTTEAYTGPLSFTVTEEQVNITGCQTSASGAFVIPSQIVGKPVVSMLENTFSDCTQLTSISLPASLVNIPNPIFLNCNSLEQISVDLGNSALSSEDGVLFNKNKTKLLYYPDAKAGDYIVPDTVTSIGSQACYSCDKLYSVVIPESVDTISWLAFGNCSQLQQSVFLGNAPTSCHSLAFNNTATNFKIYYPEGKTGFTPDLAGYPTESFDGRYSFTIETSVDMFSNITSRWITITDFPTTIGGTLTLPSSLINLPVKQIAADAFYGCNQLTRIIIPGSITAIGDEAFHSCSQLQTILFKGNAPSMGVDVFDATYANFSLYYFADKTGFSEPNWEGYPSETYNGLFSFEIVDEEIVITDYPTTESGGLTIPETILGLPIVSIADDAFMDCSNLTSITLPASLRSIGNKSFWRCLSLTNVTMGSQLTVIGDYAFNQCSSITQITLPESLTSIGTWAFGDCSSLQSIVIPQAVASIKNYAFGSCPSLKTVLFKGDAPASLGRDLFSDAHDDFTIHYFGSKTGFSTPSWRGYPAEAYTGPFSFNIIDDKLTLTAYTATGIVELSLPSSLIGLPVVAINASAFANHSSLTRIIVPESIIEMNYHSFWGCSLNSVVFEGNAPSIGSTSLGDGVGLTVYYGNDKAGFTNPWNGYTTEAYDSRFSFAPIAGGLELIDFPTSEGGTVTIPTSFTGKPVVSIAGNAFFSCQHITELSIPASVISIAQGAMLHTTSLQKITVDPANPAFSEEDGILFNLNKTQLLHCPSDNKTGGGLINYTIPNTVTSVLKWAFLECSQLQNITLPTSVTRIDSQAFFRCSSLTSAVFLGDAPTFGGSVFDDAASSFTIYYSDQQTGFSSPTFQGYPSESFEGAYTFSVIGDAVRIDSYSSHIQAPVSIPSTFAGRPVQWISGVAFGDKKTTSYSLPESVTVLGVQAFRNNRYLTRVRIPSQVTTVNNLAFENCGQLERALFSGDDPTSFGTDVFVNAHNDFTIYYFRGKTGFTTPMWHGYPSVEIDHDAYPAAEWLFDHDLPYDTDLETDINGDGVNLLMEYALHLDPRENNQKNLPQVIIDDEVGIIGLTYPIGSPGVTYTVYSSTDLLTWTTDGMSEVNNGNLGSSYMYITGSRQFLRLEVKTTAP